MALVANSRVEPVSLMENISGATHAIRLVRDLAPRRCVKKSVQVKAWQTGGVVGWKAQWGLQLEAVAHGRSLLVGDDKSVCA